MASLVNSLPVNTFSATTTIVHKIYGIEPILITLNYLICPISHAVFAFPVNWMLTKKGIKVSYCIAAVLMIVGIWLRTTLSADGAYLCLLGSFLCGGSGLFIMNSASKITMNWFRS
jgi:fucose permease